MIWTRLKISANDSPLPSSLFVEEISNLLVISGVETFTVEDFSDLKDTLSGGEIFYDYIDDGLLENEDAPAVIYAFFGNDEEGAFLFEETKSALEKFIKENEGYSSVTLEKDEVRDEDWENNWRQYFKPFAVGKKLTVKPTWEELPDELRKGREIIEIDPSSSFGTGSHATTKLCMERLEEIIKGGERVLDMGTGSGILTIASLKLGAKSAVAVDIDEVAARIAGENMLQNNFGEDSVKVYDGDILANKRLYDEVGGGYDVICANIVAGIIILMADMFYEKLAPSGRLIASGIITEREDEVRLALEKAGFKTLSAKSEDDWSVIVLTK